MTTDLADRYGTPSRWARPAAVSLATVLAVVGLGWLGWTVWFHTNPGVTSELVSFEVTSDHETQARLDVRLGDDGEATCRLRAFAEDHTPVNASPDDYPITPVGPIKDGQVQTAG